MKTLWKKLSVRLLSAVLAVSCVTPAFAANIVDIKPNGSGGFTISPPGTGENPPAMGQDLESFQSVVEGTLMPTVQQAATTITSICTIICLVAFLISVTKLATSAGNPAARQRAIQGILFSGIALTLFGGAWVVVSFFWNFF